MTETEYFDQQKWMEIHRNADELIATKDGVVIAALYRSPAESFRETQAAYVKEIRDFADTLELA